MINLSSSRPLVLGVAASFLGLCIFGSSAWSEKDGGWPNFESTEPKSKKSPRSTPEQRAAERQKASEAIKRFAMRTFLEADEGTNYSTSMQELIGQYFFVDKDGKIRLLGGNFPVEQIKLDLKDAIVFHALVDDKWNAGVTLPFLKVEAGQQLKTELLLQDTGTVQLQGVTVDKVTCYFPKSIPADADNAQIFFLTAATVTSISKKAYESGKADASATVAIVSIGGSAYTLTDVQDRFTMINVSSRRATPIKRAAGESDEQYRVRVDAECAGVRNAKNPFSLVVGALRDPNPVEALAPEPLQGKLFGVSRVK